MKKQSVLLACLLLSGCASERCYKGMLHAHSFWSDGDVPPEEAVAWYKDRGYQFMSLTDHNQLQTDTNRWRKVSGEYWKREKVDYLRLKTVAELEREFNEPDRFLLMPGHEANRYVRGLQAHLNIINTDKVFLIPDSMTTPAESFSNVWNAAEGYAALNERNMLLMVNHPDWPYFDIQPDVLIHNPKIRFYELCNADGGAVFDRHPLWYTKDKYFDIVNAFRIEDGLPPVYGVGSDDTHHYSPGDTKHSRPGHAWVGVFAHALTTDAILESMKAGRFYTSTGVELKQIDFDGSVLKVAVVPVRGVRYKIKFVVTCKGFDRTVTQFEDPLDGKKPFRVGTRYSDAIGCTVRQVEGPSAEYRLSPNDLYVRAVVVSDKKPENKATNEPDFQTAWTQPFLPAKAVHCP